MNERFEFTTPIEPATFDRLADGELTAAEEQALLATLDARPDGWRRCALAFLEARAWKDGLGPLAFGQRAGLNGEPCATGFASAALHEHGNDGQFVTSARAKREQRIRTLAVAASIAVAFLLGSAAHREWTSRTAAPQDPIVAEADRGSPSDNAIALRDRSRTDGGANSHDLARTVTMTLVDGQGNVEREIEVPVVETDRFDLRWLQTRPSVMPQQVVEALRRSGHTVEEQRLFVPVWLDDGRQAIVALDRAEVKYTGMQF